MGISATQRDEEQEVTMMTMTIIEVAQRTPELLAQLLQVWERSVRASHDFLTTSEIEQIKIYVPQALAEVPHLLVAVDEEGRPLGFMGIADTSLEMLFLAPEARGQGLGRRLLQYGIAHHGVNTLTVNEQNPQARGFYEHMGFVVERRSELDEQGNPYPLLYMRRDENRRMEK